MVPCLFLQNIFVYLLSENFFFFFVVEITREYEGRTTFCQTGLCLDTIAVFAVDCTTLVPLKFSFVAGLVLLWAASRLLIGSFRGFTPFGREELRSKSPLQFFTTTRDFGIFLINFTRFLVCRQQASWSFFRWKQCAKIIKRLANELELCHVTLICHPRLLCRLCVVVRFVVVRET